MSAFEKCYKLVLDDSFESFLLIADPELAEGKARAQEKKERSLSTTGGVALFDAQKRNRGLKVSGKLKKKI